MHWSLERIYFHIIRFKMQKERKHGLPLLVSARFND